MTPDQQALVGRAADIMRGRTSNDRLAAVEATATRTDPLLWRELVDAGLVDFVGTDAHHLRHTDTLLKRTLAQPHLAKLLRLPLLNNTL